MSAPRVADLLEPVLRIQAEIRDAVVAACEDASLEGLSRVVEEAPDDTIYAIDRVGEQRLVELCESELAAHGPIVLIAEGLSEGAVVLPRGSSEADARFRVIVDPIDGTRGLMYQKRSAWVLTGVAPNRGAATSLADVELAAQTEIPVLKQHLSDVAWAIQGRGAEALRYDRLRSHTEPLELRPSRARTLEHGFSQVSRFFPGGRAELAAIDDEIMRGALGPPVAGRAQSFEDQYVCSGGQLYELMSGHDRFCADLRPWVERLRGERGETPGICAHPYDLCTELIARECGVEVCDARGERLCAPLDVTSDVDWVGYANGHLRELVEPLLQQALGKRGLL